MPIKFSATVWREEDQFVSLCPELGVSSFGPNPDEAVAMLREAVELYLLNAKEEGLLDDLSFSLTNPSLLQTSFEVELA